MELLKQQFPVHGFDRAELDICDSSAVEAALAAATADVVMNCAAYTRVDRAEDEAELAYKVNGIGPGVLARLCAERDALMVHVSTDYVFDGTASLPYEVDADTNPLGVYGQSKRQGEIAVAEAAPRHLIVRTAWVYGVGGQNFVRTILRLAQERPELRIVEDQIGTPTWSATLAAVLLQLVEQQAPTGTYHVTNSGVTSWYDFAVAIVEEARTLGWELACERVVPIPSAAYPTRAVRPQYSVLSRRKTEALLGYNLPHWRSDLRQMLLKLRKVNL